MTGSSDEIPAASANRDRLRASHADREQVIETVKNAFVQGRLSRDELDDRVSQVFAARTYADLAAVTADLPAGLPVWPAARPSASTGVKTGVRVIVSAAGVLAVLVLLHPDNGIAFLGGIAAAAVLVVASILTVAMMIESRHQKRSGGPLPPGPARRPARPASRHQIPPAPDRQAPGFSGKKAARPDRFSLCWR